MDWRIFYKDVLPFCALTTVQCTEVGVNILFKAATLKGLSYYVFIVYSYAVSALVLLLPLPFIFHRFCLKFPNQFFIFWIFFFLISIHVLDEFLLYAGQLSFLHLSFLCFAESFSLECLGKDKRSWN